MTNIETLNFGILSALIGLTFFLSVQSFTLWRDRPFQFLAVFFSANLISQLDDLFWTQEFWHGYVSLTNAYIPFLYCIAPSIYLYVRHLVQPNKLFSSASMLRHSTGFLLALIASTPYYLLDSTIKLDRLLAPSGTLESLGYITLGPKVALLGFIPFSIFYLVLILLILKTHLVSIKAYFSDIENKDLSWIRWSILILIGALGASTIQLFLPATVSEQGREQMVFLLFEFFWIACFGILAFKQKSIYEGKSTEKDDQEKYSRSKLNEEDSERLSDKLQKAMTEKHLYREPTLTLRRLSDETGIPEIRISQVLNTVLQQNFYDFINGWRIKEACEKMQDGEGNILQITYDIGFNSRSTFNTAFKKHVGQTPSAYRKKVQ